MRLLLLSHVPNDPYGGSSRIYHMLECAMTQRGHDVTLLHFEDFAPWRNRSTRWLAQRVFLPRLMRHRVMRLDPFGFDVIMASSGTAEALFGRLRRTASRPLLINHLHGLGVFDNVAAVAEAASGHWGTSWRFRHVAAPLQEAWDAWGVEQGDITVVQNWRDYAELGGGIRGRSPVILISPAVHPELHAASGSVSPPERRDSGKLLWFGSWESRKGAWYVPDAFRRIRRARPDATLVIGGTGKSYRDIAPFFDERDRGAIDVKPRISNDEHIGLMNECAVFLFVSLSEGFGLALAESMCFGMAAVTTSTGFAGDHLRDGEHARIVPPTSYHLARAALELMQDDGLRARIAGNGRTLARTFTLDRMAEAYELLMEQELAAMRSGAAALRQVPSRAAVPELETATAPARPGIAAGGRG